MVEFFFGWGEAGKNLAKVMCHFWVENLSASAWFSHSLPITTGIMNMCIEMKWAKTPAFILDI